MVDVKSFNRTASAIRTDTVLGEHHFNKPIGVDPVPPSDSSTLSTYLTGCKLSSFTPRDRAFREYSGLSVDPKLSRPVIMGTTKTRRMNRPLTSIRMSAGLTRTIGIVPLLVDH